MARNNWGLQNNTDKPDVRGNTLLHYAVLWDRKVLVYNLCLAWVQRGVESGGRGRQTRRPFTHMLRYSVLVRGQVLAQPPAKPWHWLSKAPP